ncbi:MAG: CvpA family protein [Alysiella sp.]|uniref:CvpA family protein n=1 Tax=Alysiella sp. TaxID=1872483 RepID=UPI0026DB9F9B|nr:CvpA family protein [Alysiella sp.]MDO4434624.1 CvpA family protein [Alysiella sp.]
MPELALTTFDYLAIGTILICLALSATRGLMRELLDFTGWVVALICARMFASSVADAFLINMKPRELAVVCGFVLVYILVRIGVALIQRSLDFAIKTTKLSSLNRFLGALLGVVKGILIVSIAVLFCSFSSLPENEAWKNAQTAPFFESLAAFSIPYLPDFLKKQIHLSAHDGLKPLPLTAPDSGSSPSLPSE